MHIEKANEPFFKTEGWREKLDQLNTLPGQEPFDKGLAWEKLYDRLKKQPLRRKIPIYGLAAACLLGMGIFLGFRLIQPKQAFANKQEVHAIPVEDSSAAIPVSQGDHLIPSNKEQVKPEIRIDHKSLTHSIPKIEPIIQPQPTSTEIGAGFPEVLKQGTGTFSPVRLSMAGKPMAVISLNEINLVADSNSAGSSDRQYHFFRIKLYNPANLYLPSVAEEQPAHPLIKFQLSAQN